MNRFPMNTMALALNVMTALLLAAVPAASAQEQLWLTQFGSASNDLAQAIMPVDVGSGGESVIVAGKTSGDLAGLSAGLDDVYIARYDGAGNVVWMNQFGTTNSEWAQALAPDGAGGFFAAGITGGDLAGPNSQVGNFDAFLARFDGDGSQLWIKQFGTSMHDEATSMAPDGAGGVFVAGATGGDMVGGGFGWQNVWIARYDGAGDRLWVHQFGTQFEGEDVRALATDGVGGVFVTGSASGSLGGPSAGKADIYLAHYDSAGTQSWIRQFGSSERDVANDIIPFGQGGVAMAGATWGDLGGPSAGAEDAFVARFDFAGEQIWLQQFGSSDRDQAHALAPDGEEGLWVTGTTQGGLSGSTDIFFTLHDRMGSYYEAYTFGSIGYESALAIAPVDGLGVVIAGHTSGDLGGKNAGGNDVFMTRFDGGVYHCYAECEGNYVLDIFDFLCFQNAFVKGEPYACNCNTSTGAGVCDIFDFLCFQNAFVAGCP